VTSVNIARAACLKTLHEEREEEGHRPTAFNTLGRGSQAGGCDRSIAFDMMSAEPSEEILDSTLMAFKTGQHLHELVQAAMVRQYDMDCEVPVDLRPLGYPISGHADGVYVFEGLTIVAEIKTKKAYPMKLARRQLTPELHEVQQAGMYGMGVGADAIHLIYYAKDNAGTARKPTDFVEAGETVEWLLFMDEPVPGDGRTVEQVASAEATRITAIAGQVEDGMIPERFIPGYGTVPALPDPGSMDAPWRCRYCDYWGLCETLPAGQVPAADVLIPIRKDADVGSVETIETV
jgi:hypothetical protein